MTFKLQSLGFRVTNANPQEPESCILVGMPHGKGNVSIQVVTSVRAHREYKRRPEFDHYVWQVDSGVMQSKSENLLYAFVDLQGRTDLKCEPVVYIMQSDAAAQLIPKDWNHSALWLCDVVADQYRDRWDNLLEACH